MKDSKKEKFQASIKNNNSNEPKIAKKKTKKQKIDTIKTSKEAKVYLEYIEKRINTFEELKARCTTLIIELENKEENERELGKLVVDKLGQDINEDTLKTVLDLIKEQQTEIDSYTKLNNEYNETKNSNDSRENNF